MTKPAEMYACFHAKEFPAQALLRLRAELRDQAFAVMEGDPPLAQVCSLNTKARRFGVMHGMTAVEVQSFPAVTSLARSLKEEAAARQAVLACARAYSPRVEDCSDDRALLYVADITGMEALFGAPEDLARALILRVKALGITGCVAVSSNFHAAVLSARGMQIGIRIIPAGQEAAALALLPLSVLNMDEEQAERFSQWGIHTLGMLAALPERGLIARLGQEGKRLRQLARGTLPHLFHPVETPFTLEESMELDSPVELLDSLLFAVSVLLEQLIHRAADHLVALASASLTLTLENATYTRTVRPALPTNEKQLWIKLIHLDLEAHPPQAAILALTLKAEPGSTSKVQAGLFSPQLPEASRLDVTLARIRAIVGDEHVGRAVLNDTHAAEGFRVEPFTLPSAITITDAAQPVLSMRQLRPPETIQITWQDQRPATFTFRQKLYAVEQAYGPWKGSGAWWSASLWSFEHWDLVARSQDGSMLYCCVVCDRLQNLWQMAALYD